MSNVQREMPAVVTNCVYTLVLLEGSVRPPYFSCVCSLKTCLKLMYMGFYSIQFRQGKKKTKTVAFVV